MSAKSSFSSASDSEENANDAGDFPPSSFGSDKLPLMPNPEFILIPQPTPIMSPTIFRLHNSLKTASKHPSCITPSLLSSSTATTTLGLSSSCTEIDIEQSPPNYCTPPVQPEVQPLPPSQSCFSSGPESLTRQLFGPDQSSSSECEELPRRIKEPKRKTKRFSRCPNHLKYLCQSCSKSDCNVCANCRNRRTRRQACKEKPKEKCLTWLKMLREEQCKDTISSSTVKGSPTTESFGNDLPSLEAYFSDVSSDDPTSYTQPMEEVSLNAHDNRQSSVSTSFTVTPLSSTANTSLACLSTGQSETVTTVTSTKISGTVSSKNVSCTPKYLNREVYSLAMNPKKIVQNRIQNYRVLSTLRRIKARKRFSAGKIKPAVAPKSCIMYVCIDSTESSAEDVNAEETEVVVLQTSEEPTVNINDPRQQDNINQFCVDKVLHEE